MKDTPMKKWLFVFLFIYQAVAFSESAGKVLFTSKEVIAKRNNQQRTLTRGAEFFEGDVISTKDGALAQLQHSNGTLVSLQPNSEYSVVSYHKEATVGNSAYLAKGGLESSTATSDSKRKSLLSTPLVALAIAGTKYRAAIFCNTATCKKFAIQVTEGLVIVDNRYPLGPGQQQSSGIYNASTKQMTYGPINWSANGWVDFPSSLAGNSPDFIDPSTLTQVVNATITNSATHTVTTTILPIVGSGACPCC